MIYIRAKYTTMVSDGVNTALKEYSSSVSATAVEAEAHYQRFIWNTADGLGMAIAYNRLSELTINGNVINPINRETVAAALVGPIIPPGPCPPPFSRLFRVRVLPDRNMPAHFVSYYAPGSREETALGYPCSVVFSMGPSTKLLKIFANGEEVSPDAGSVPTGISQVTFLSVSSDIIIGVYYEVTSEV